MIEFFNLKQLAEICHCSRTTVRNAINDGVIVADSATNRYLITFDESIKFVIHTKRMVWKNLPEQDQRDRAERILSDFHN